MILVAETGPTAREEEPAAPTIELMALPLEVVMQDSPEKVSIGGALMEMASKMSIEECSKKDPTEKVRMEEAVDNLEKDLTKMIETRGSSEMATPTGYFFASAALVEPSDLTPHASSIGEIL